MLGALILPIVLLATTSVARWTPSSQPSSIVPGAFIIQVDSGALVKRGLPLGETVSSVLGQVEDSGIPYTMRQEFQGGDLFQGASIKVHDGVTASDLLQISGVQRVWPVRRHPRPYTPRTDDGAGEPVGGNPISGSDLLSGATPLAISPKVQLPPPQAIVKRATASYSNDTFGPHIMTGVNNTHAAGQLGSGVLVCILDSGIDYLNPLLGGCFGPGCHVSVGYDLVGDNYNGDNSPVPGPDPYATCDPHGTHVSGIVGALANNYGLSGVAPQASLGMFRLLGCTGGTTDDVILQALVKAMQAGCKVINMSIGGPAGWLANTPAELMVDAATAQGIFTVASVGNEGQEGLFYAEQPASSATGTGAASVAVRDLPAYNATVFGFDPVPYLSPKPFNATGSGYRLYFTSLNASTTNDACNPLPSGTPNLAPYIVVVQRGTCGFVVKYANIVAAGGRMVLLYNFANATQQLYLDKGTSGLDALATMRYQDGLKLLNTFVANTGRVVIKFPAGPLVRGIVDDIVGGMVSPSSNYGPTLDLFGQPTLSAPGVNIVSTFPLSLGGIGIDSGTSMASPFIAGAAAVLMSARASEGLSVAQIKGLLSTTSQIYASTQNPASALVTVPLQGSGLIQVDLALAAKTFISPSVLLLNDTTYLNNVQNITITNRNPYITWYSLSSAVGQGRGLYGSTGKILPATSPPVVAAAQASVAFSRSRIQVAAGASVTFIVTITPPSLSAADAALYPIYSGWIRINGAPASGVFSESYTVPYFGISGSMFNVPIIDTSTIINGPGYAYPFIATPDDIQLQATAYTFPVGPLVLTRFAMGSPYISIDLVAANISFTGTISSNNNGPTSRSKRHSISASTHPDRMSKSRRERILFSDVPTIGNIYNAGYQPRDARVTSTSVDQEVQFNGTYTTAGNAIGTVARGVSYRILVRACKITGDARFEDQYESWLSPSFSYKP